MAEAQRIFFQPTRTQTPSFANPEPVIDPYRTMVGELNKFVDTTNDYLDQQTRIEARKAGAAAALQPDFQTQKGNTIFAQEYNKAAEDIYINKTLLNTSKNLDDTYQRFQADPDKLAEHGGSLGVSVGSNVPEEFRPQFAVAYDKMLTHYVMKAKDNRITQERDMHKSLFEDSEFALTTGMANAARDGNHDLAATQMGLYLDQLNRNGPDGTRALSYEEIHSKQRVAMRMLEKSAIEGEFNRAPDKVGFIRQLADRPSFQSLYGPDDQKKVIEGLYTGLSQQLHVGNMLQAEQERKLKKQMDAYTIDVINNPTDASKLDTAKKFATAYGLREELEHLNKVSSSDEAHDDISTVRNLTSAAYRGGSYKLPDGTEVPVSQADVIGKIGNGLKPETARTILAQMEKNTTGGQDYFTSWQDYKQAQDRIEAAFPVRVDMMGKVMAEDVENDRIQKDLKANLYDQMDQNFQSWSKGERRLDQRPDARQKAQLMIKNAKSDQDNKRLIDAVPDKYRSLSAMKAAVASKQLDEGTAARYTQSLNAYRAATGENPWRP